jgi:type IV pilus assembly protein PilM
LRTNLLPDEIITTRLVKAKKPWAVAAVALLLLGLTINYFMHYAALLTANKDEPQMVAQMNAAKAIAGTVATATTENTNLVTAFDKVVTTAKNLQSNVDGRLLWLELFKAIDAAMPRDTGKRLETDDNISKREEIHIEAIECEFMPDIAVWQAGAQRYYTPTAKPVAPAAPAAPAGGDAAAPAGAAPAAGQSADAAAPATPAAPPAAPATPAPDATAAAPPAEGAAAAGNSGWIIELRGYHLHNGNPADEGQEFLKRTIIKNLELGKVKLPDGPKGELIDVAMSDLGIKMPTVMTREKIRTVTYEADSPENIAAGGSRPVGPEAGPGGVPAGAAAGDQKKMFKLRKYLFVIQFCWQPQPRGQRLEKMAQKKAAEPGTAAAAAEAPKPNS